MDTTVELHVKEAADRWRNLVDQQQAARRELRHAIIKTLLNNYSMTTISDLTSINRTTLYYIIWGKKGRNIGE